MNKINPRKIARLITKGKIPLQFIGLKSFEVLEQEIFSLLNRYTPETMTEFEITVFRKDTAATVEGIMKLDSKKQQILFNKFSPDTQIQFSAISNKEEKSAKFPFSFHS